MALQHQNQLRKDDLSQSDLMLWSGFLNGPNERIVIPIESNIWWSKVIAGEAPPVEKLFGRIANLTERVPANAMGQNRREVILGYRRTDYLEQRRGIMRRWANYVTSAG